jgi:hypothetical protein
MAYVCKGMVWRLLFMTYYQHSLERYYGTFTLGFSSYVFYLWAYFLLL